MRFYTKPNGEQVPSVTSLIDWAFPFDGTQFSEWCAREGLSPSQINLESTLIGSKIHKMVEEGDIDCELVIPYDVYQDVKAVEFEQQLIHDDFAGTADIIVSRVGGTRAGWIDTISDIKTWGVWRMNVLGWDRYMEWIEKGGPEKEFKKKDKLDKLAIQLGGYVIARTASRLHECTDISFLHLIYPLTQDFTEFKILNKEIKPDIDGFQKILKDYKDSKQYDFLHKVI